MRRGSIACLAVALLAACQPATEAPVSGGAEAVVAGTVTYRERIALPADATIEVRLEDVSRADAPTVLAERSIAAAGRQVPIPFELTFPASRIEADGRYGVRAAIRAADGELMFTMPSHRAVLEAGAAPESEIELVLQRAQARAGSDDGITGAAWRLVAIRRPGAAEEAVGTEPQYTLEFGADGRYSGRAHCNSFTGTYERTGQDALRIRAGAATLAACPQPSIADEYLRVLASVTSYRASGDELRLTYNTGGELAFVRAAGQAAAAPEVGRTFVFDCDGDLSFTVRTGPGEVALWEPAALGGTYQVLAQTPAASGARYQEGDSVYWNRGELATFELGGQRYVDCRSNPSQVPWADAARRGATFRALGNEPAWYVEVFADRLTVVTDLGTNRTELEHSGAAAEGGRTTYRAAAEGREATVVVERRACADSMSGEGFEAVATVTIDGVSLRGCGRFL
jgi:putative lipoprotein